MNLETIQVVVSNGQFDLLKMEQHVENSYLMYKADILREW